MSPSAHHAAPANDDDEVGDRLRELRQWPSSFAALRAGSLDVLGIESIASEVDGQPVLALRFASTERAREVGALLSGMADGADVVVFADSGSSDSGLDLFARLVKNMPRPDAGPPAIKVTEVLE